MVTPLLLLLLGCRAPFGADRHDLVGDRIAAVTLSTPDDDGRLHADAWLVVDGRLWHDGDVEATWWWLDPASPDVDAIPVQGAPPVATGASVDLTLPFPRAANALGLHVAFPSGEVRRAVLSLGAGAPVALPPFGLSLGVVDGSDVTASTPEQLEREARLGWTATSAASVPLDRWARLEATWADGRPEALSRVRWTTTAGTFLELDEVRTDWAPAHLFLDDLELQALDVLEPGPVTVLALALDDAGGNAVALREVWVGEPLPGVVTAGRWLATDADVADAALVRGRLVADDAAPTGLVLVDAEPVASDALPDEDPYGVDALGCAGPVSGPFDPSWLASGRCRRDDVVDATVVVEVDR